MPQLTVQGFKVRYLDQGQGPPVILLHSGASSSAQWRDLASRLVDQHRVMAPDFIGCGGTEGWSSAAPFPIGLDVELVKALVSIRAEPCHLVGHSYGGRIALELAMDSSIPLRSLVLFEPNPFWLLAEAGHVVRMREIEEVVRAYCRRFDAGRPDAAMAGFIDYWNGPGSWSRVPERHRRALLAAARAVRDVSPGTLAGDITLDRLRSVRLPALVLRGEETRQVTGPLAGVLAEHLPLASLRAIAGADHMGPLTSPGTVNPVIVEFLASA